MGVSSTSGASVIPPPTSNAQNSGGADLTASLRAPAPGRPNSAQPEGSDQGPPGSASSDATPAGGATTAAAPPGAPAGTSATATGQPSFGQTLAASMTSSPATASGQRPSAPAKGSAKAKSTDSRTPDASAAGGAASAMQLLISGNPPAPDAGAAATAANAAPAANAASAAQTSADANAEAEAASSAPVAAAAARTPTALAAAAQFAAPQASATPKAATPSAADDTDTDGGSDADAHPAGTLTGAARIALPDALAAAAARALGTSESNSSSAGSGGDSGASTDGGDAFALAAATTASTSADPGAAAATNSAAQTGTVTAQLHSAVGSNAWANELGARVHWMAGAGISSASLRLTPEQLGPVEVKISVHESAASVWFSAAQPETRTALEQALPRLKELFAAQGMNLAQAGVSDQSARGAEQRAASVLAPRSLAARAASATSVTTAVRTHQGLIDTYA